MKHAIALLLAAAIAPLALGASALERQSLGTLEAAIIFCAQVKPADAATFEEQARLLVSGASDEDLSALRGTTDYKEDYAAARDALTQSSHEEAVAACSEFLPAKASDNDGRSSE